MPIRSCLSSKHTTSKKLRGNSIHRLTCTNRVFRPLFSLKWNTLWITVLKYVKLVCILLCISNKINIERTKLRLTPLMPSSSEMPRFPKFRTISYIGYLLKQSSSSYLLLMCALYIIQISKHLSKRLRPAIAR